MLASEAIFGSKQKYACTTIAAMETCSWAGDEGAGFAKLIEQAESKENMRESLGINNVEINGCCGRSAEGWFSKNTDWCNVK